ncbi:putative RNase [Paratrimastix pyriformis]|uniref:RNase n=1 Tax=Paratrimastix pyriformis TaxID=342808 RepID=A0ABQ8UPP5_9EUKA|nr:putative RNase [Paratrimastix pyriformis]
MRLSSVLLLVSLLASAVLADNSWTFMDFVTRWTGTACVQNPQFSMNSGNVPRGVANFTIHGSWPDRDDGTWPAFCNDSYPFSWNQIADLKPQLDLNWPSFNGPNADFYTHEWNKHGTCALNVAKDEHDYFQRTLALNSRYDLSAALARAGFVPSTTNTYNVNDMTAAISKAIGKTAAIQCANVNKKLYFLAVHICLDKNFQPMNCPAFVVKDCQQGCYVSTAMMPPVTDSCYR